MDSKVFADKIIELMLEKKAYDVKLLNIRDLSSIADFFIVCSAGSEPQVKAIADNIDKSLADEGIKCTHREGFDSLNWVLLDYFDVVIHVFKEDARSYYNLEKLWGDAPIFEVAEDGTQTRI